MLERLKDVARQRPWVPDHGSLLLRQRFDRNRNVRRGYSALTAILQRHLAAPAPTAALAES